MNRTGSELLHTMLLATSALVASTLLTSSGALAGGPSGGKVAVGSATITNPSSTQTVVNQTSQKALINWNSFSVPTGSSITFDQPNTTSLTVNRVLGPNASTIDGQLLGNGNIWLINANGILFGHGSQVDVGALLATTSDLSDDDFRKGRYRFTKPGNPGASVVNQGSITAAQGGSVVLSGSQVSNQGIVQANLGTVVLGGANAFTVDLDGDNLLRYQITAPVTAPPKGASSSGSALVSNSGTIAAAGGHILLTARAARNVQDDVINNTGQIEATTVSSHDGEIDFDAGPDGTVNAGGTINASGTGSGQTGGAINVAGGTVNVTNGATINASGDAGGGTIQIGGGLHGKGTIANSNTTNIGNATISANATTKGNGGTVAIWSNGNTSFAGTVSATGGAQGGNGGLVETSGGNVQVGTSGKVITSAAKGTTGDWLIDPTNIDILTSGTDGIGGSNISPATVINALGSTNVTLEATNDITISNAVDYSSTNTLSLLASQDIIANAGIQNSGTGAINLIAGWDGETTNLTQLTNSGVYGNNNGSITIGGEGASGNVAIGSAGGTTTFAAANLTIESDSGFAQAGYHGAGGGNLVADLTGSLTLNGYAGDGYYAQFGNGSLNGDVPGNITGNISINATGTTTLNVGEGGGHVFIGNFAQEGSIESGNVALTTGYVDGLTGQNALGSMLIADLGTSSAAGSGGNVTLALTNPQTDFINTYLGVNGIEYNSPNALTLLSVDNITLPYSIQNDGTGSLTVLAGWNPSVAPADVLTAPNAYGQNGGFVWVVAADGGLEDYNPNSEGETDVDSGLGTSIGSMGGTTTIGGAQIYVEGLSGYAQIGYHNSGGTGTINVVANGTPGQGGLTGVSACFDGNANICVIGGRQGDTDENNDPTYAQIGDLGLGVSGTASSNINVTATGNIAVAGGGIYNNTSNPEDPQVPNAYGMIGNGDGAQTVAQTVSGAINVNVAGQLNFASSTGTGSEAWLGNRTGSGGLASGNVTAIFGSENDSGPVDFGNMIFADLGTTSQAGSGGNVTVGQIDGNLKIQNDSGDLYSSPNDLTVLSGGDIDVESDLANSGTGSIMLVAGWNGTTLGSAAQLESANAFGLNDATITIGGSNASGDAAAGTAGGTMTVLTNNLDVESDNGIAQLGYANAAAGAIDVVALGNVTVDALNGNYAQIGNGGSAVTGNVGGAIGISAGGTILVESDSGSSNAAIGNIGGSTSSESGGITLGANEIDINSAGAGSNAFVGNGSTVASTGGATGDIGITSGDLSIDASGDGSAAFVGDGVRFNSSGTTGGNININSATIELVANEPDSETSEARIANRGVGNVVGSYDIVTSGNIQLSASDANLAAIGNGEDGSGTSSGNLTVQSGGTLTLASTDGGQTRIGDGAASDSTVDVSAAGDIDLSVTGTPGEYGSGAVLIGNLGGAVGGDISVTSTGGSIDLNAAEDGSAIQIGSIQNDVTANVSGNIDVSAQDNVTLEAAGQNTAVQIGNGGTQTQGNDTGTVSMTATTGMIAATLNGDGAFIQLGNGGNASVGTATGDTSLTAGTSLQLSVGGSAADSGSYIQVGDGAAFDATTGGGNMVVNAASMSTTNSVDFAGNSLDIALSGSGDSIGADSELRVTVNDLALSTNNGNALVYSTQAISLGAGEGGVNLGTGDLDLASAGAVTQTNAINAGSLNVSTASGAITLTNGANAVTLANLSTSGSDDATLYDAADLTINGANVGGDLTLLTKGNLTFTDSAAAGGAILAVAGWDGTTTSPSALTTGTAYGNNGGSITVGGTSQDDNVDIGSASGSMTLAADNVNLTANNGYVQVGYNGAGSGPIDVVASGNVTLTAGTQNDEYAQIGNGGWNTSGNESGSITVDAAGAVALAGGSGAETYAQIGHGGLASNSNSKGYNDTGLITVDGQSVTLAAGSSQGSYAQIGSGGYLSGQNSSGTLTLGGDINVNAVTTVTLAGNGRDAYAQIGNGGDFVNTGAANNAMGTISGDIDVSVTDASNHITPDPVSATAGSGADSYAQIGNGGQGENTPAEGATATFNISGNITVADLTLQGSDTGEDGYAQVGNGDASGTGTGNISGDITIGPGIDVTIINGTTPGSDSMIGNVTGFGSVSGTIIGYTPGESTTTPIDTPAGNGAVATTSQTQVTPTDTDVNVVTVTPENNGTDQPDSIPPPPPINQPPGPLDQLADNGNSEGADPTDALTSSLGQSLDTRAHNAPITVVKSIIPGVLSEVVTKDPHGPHGVPPADEDYSSWGNEALWQW